MLAAELANLDPDTADTGTVRALIEARWVARADVAPADVCGLLEWGARLRTVFTAPSAAAKVGQLNTLLAEVAARPYISTHDGQPPHLHYYDHTGPVVARVRAQTAAALSLVLVDAGAQRIGSCAAPGCPTVFVDTSRAGRRTYCTPRCATRVNVSAHRARAARHP